MVRKTKMSTKIPKVSVLMPAYNAEKYIGEAIESILNQTFTDFEFIIINDGSKDNTADIVKRYAAQDKRIKFINNSENKGLIAVLNEGLDVCRGVYIARMDSDDISFPERFAKQVEYMDAHPECGVLGTWVEKIGTHMKRIFRNRAKVRVLDMIVHGSQVVHPSAMIRRSVLVENNIKYDPQYKYAEDYAFWVDILQCAEIHNLHDILLKYRWHNNNVSLVHENEQNMCTERIRHKILSKLLSSDIDIKKISHITKESNERFYLFGFLPVIRRKQYSIFKTKYYLFEKIPLIKEKDGKIYLFEYIKIGKLK